MILKNFYNSRKQYKKKIMNNLIKDRISINQIVTMTFQIKKINFIKILITQIMNSLKNNCKTESLQFNSYIYMVINWLYVSILSLNDF